ncbi:MAG: tol-pal system-associated acyl-CoA thioesterase [Gammaproteobacteria bacterium]|nr:tol-pal system-associated acyl-CoA thioesterase [Gammaproteobacteria bacterium]
MKFSWPVRVYYEDTDSGGVVYYANYLKFFERARTEFLRQFKVEQDLLIKEQDVIFAVRNINVDYHKPAVFNDLLTVTTEVIELNKASLVFQQTIYRENDETMLCQASCKVACLKATQMKPRPIPDSLVQHLSQE